MGWIFVASCVYKSCILKSLAAVYAVLEQVARVTSSIRQRWTAATPWSRTIWNGWSLDLDAKRWIRTLTCLSSMTRKNSRRLEDYCPATIVRSYTVLTWIYIKIKGKDRFTYATQQAAYGASSALCVAYTAGVQSMPQPKPVLCTNGPWPAVVHQYGTLVCRGLHPCERYKYSDYYSVTYPRPDQRDLSLIWPGWLTHSGHFTHEVVTCQP